MEQVCIVLPKAWDGGPSCATSPAHRLCHAHGASLTKGSSGLNPSSWTKNLKQLHPRPLGPWERVERCERSRRWSTALTSYSLCKLCSEDLRAKLQAKPTIEPDYHTTTFERSHPRFVCRACSDAERCFRRATGRLGDWATWRLSDANYLAVPGLHRYRGRGQRDLRFSLVLLISTARSDPRNGSNAGQPTAGQQTSTF